MAAGILVNQLSETSQEKLTILVEKAQDPMEAMALVLAVLLCEESASPLEDTNWRKLLQSSSIPTLEWMVNQQIKEIISVNLENRLPLVELTVPALKTLSETQYQTFKEILQKVMDLDGQQSVFEQSVYLLITRYLDVHFGLVEAHRVRYKKAKQIEVELQLIFSTLAHYGHNAQNKKLNQVSASLAFERAMQFLDLNHLQVIEMNKKNQKLFQRATEKLNDCSEPLKQKIVEALVICVEHDGKVEPVEKELILAIAATINAPIPRLSL